MRHGKKVNHLGRKAGHRKALMKNMSNSLVKYKRINTTLAKAKALRTFIEPLLTKAKKDNTHSRRIVFGYLQDKESVSEMFGPIAAKIGERPGGYTRVIKTGFRRSHGSEMAMIELVDFNELMLADAGTTKTKKKRSRRGGKSKAKADAPPVAEETNEEVVEEAPESGGPDEDK